MGFGTKLKRKLRKLGHKIAHGASIGARKGGKFLQKAGKFAAKAAPLVAMIPDPRVQKFAEALSHYLQPCICLPGTYFPRPLPP